MILVVRGDLRSETGWSRATRALLQAVESEFSLIVGVDLHFHPHRSRTEFPYPIVDDAAALKLIRQAADSVVLHATLPAEVTRVAGAINLGWWFWETDAYPTWGDWAERIDCLDGILVPSQWQADWLARAKAKPPIFIVRWPHRENPKPIQSRRWDGLRLCRTWSREEHSDLLSIDRRYHSCSALVRFFQARTLVRHKSRLFNDTFVPFGTMLAAHDGYFFAVQTDAPRKGLPALISEWKRYREKARTNKALVIRFASLNVNLSASEIVERFMNVALSASRGATSALEHVFLIVEQLPEEMLNRIYASATAFVSPTYGEGFGSTIVEATLAGCPPIAPGHTACDQLLSPDYRYKYKSYPYIGALVDQLPIQPSNGSWHLPEAGSIADCLLAMEAATRSERAALALQQKVHLLQLLAPSVARDTVRLAVAAARAEAEKNRPAAESSGNQRDACI